jgi:hypothetical protein
LQKLYRVRTSHIEHPAGEHDLVLPRSGRAEEVYLAQFVEPVH